MLSAVDSAFSYNSWVLPYVIGLVLTIALLIQALRVPFKRTYHKIFAALLGVICILFVDRALGAAAGSTEAYLPLSRAAVFLIPATITLSYHFTVSYVSSNPGPRLRASLLAAYAIMLTLWGILAVDASLLVPGAIKTPVGLYALAPGPAEPFLLVYFVVFLVGIFSLTFNYLYRQLPGITRRRTTYMFAGSTVFTIGSMTQVLSRDFGNPPLDFALLPIGLAIVLIGITKHGFYGITPTVETASAIPVRYELREGRSYLARDHKASFEGFSELVKNGRTGLCITRTSPDYVRKTYGLHTTPIKWLSEARNDVAIAPSDLLGLSLTVKDFQQRAMKPVVLLHGIEYLTTINGFHPVLRLIQGLNDSNAKMNGIMMLPVLPDALDKKDDGLLVAETLPLLPVS